MRNPTHDETVTVPRVMGRRRHSSSDGRHEDRATPGRKARGIRLWGDPGYSLSPDQASWITSRNDMAAPNAFQ